ncbi:hypothetical protein SRCM100623_02925 [Acetobacter pasteurianus]|uniref:Uncharacterized protein n=1 Tax=Acetobacter pasteurianus TaxID=438 RepID=A0A1A0CA05_ACEPA|nr:hypothetical protein [Acetobacter pasteurianus]OAZ59918.1 hypothetical protein SRCM100623_02925 [Acetobacter pasteurianus]
MSDSGLGAFAAYLLGRNSARCAEQNSRFISSLFDRSNAASYDQVLQLAQKGVRAVKTLGERLDSLNAELATERGRSADLEKQLEAANAANDELKRQLEAEKAHAVMLDDRLFDLSMRHARLCKKTNTKDS